MNDNRLSAFQRGSSPFRGSTASLFKEPENDFCKRCSRYIYPLELMGPVMGYKYHKLCFRCHTCDRLLDFINYRTNLVDLADRQLYCVNHSPKNGAYSFRLSSGSKSPRNVDLNESKFEFGYGNLQDNIVPSADRFSSSYNSTMYTHEVDWRTHTADKKITFNKSISEDVLSTGSNLKEELVQNSIENHLVSILTNLRADKSISKSATNVHILPLRPTEISHEIQILTEKSDISKSSKETYDDLRKYSNTSVDSSFNLVHNDSEKSSNLRNIFSEAILSAFKPLPAQTNKDIYSYEAKGLGLYNNDALSRDYKIQVDDYDNHSLSNVYNNTNIIGRHSSSNQGLEYTYDTTAYPLDIHQGIKLEVEDSNKMNIREIFQEAMITANSPQANSKKSVIIEDVDLDDRYTSRDENLKDIFYDVATKNMQKENYREAFNNTPQTQTEDNLKSIFYEAHLSNMKHGVEFENDENLKDIFYEVSFINANRPFYHPSLDVASTSQDPNLKKIYSEAIQKYNTQTTKIVQQHQFKQESIESSTTYSTTSISSASASNLSSNTSNPNLKKIMSDVIHTQATIGQNLYKPKSPSTVHIPVTVTKADPENMGNLRNILSEIITTNNQSGNTNKYNAPPIVRPDPDNLSNIKIVMSEIINSDGKHTAVRVVKPMLDLKLVEEIIGENKGYGELRLTIQYDDIRTRLSVTVHEGRNLKNLDAKGLSDPYARVYLVPDEKPSFKRKTKIIKNNLSPKWQETFDYAMSLNDALNKQLTVNLKDERGFFEKQESKFLGEVVLKLNSVPNIKNPFTRWYYLQPLNSVTNLLLNSGLATF